MQQFSGVVGPDQQQNTCSKAVEKTCANTLRGGLLVCALAGVIISISVTRKVGGSWQRGRGGTEGQA